METSCTTCGKTINRKPSTILARNYCSRACHYSSGASRPARKLGTTKQCEVCGNDFYAPRSRPRAQFCSRECKGIASRSVFACKICGTKSYGFRNQNKRWCSRACATTARRNGTTLACQQCGTDFYVARTRAALPATRFCSNACQSAWQGRNKTEHICRTCGKTFRWSPSRSKSYNITYCTLACRDTDPERAAMLLRMNAIQQMRRMTEPERIGYTLLDSLGIRYEPQALFSGKFCVDALLPDHCTVVQFDGDYWHDRKGTSTEAKIRRRVTLDRSQDAYMSTCGWTVIRLWESDLKRNLADCTEKISQHLRLPS